MKFKGAIFDMDGLLVDTERTWQEVWHELADKYHVNLPDQFVKDITGSSGPYMCRVVEKYYHVADGQKVINECIEGLKKKLQVSVPIKPGVHEILQYFRDHGIRMAVASSSAMEQIKGNLQKAEIMHYFDAIASGMEVPNGKPSPDVFLRAADLIECKPEECYVFEDSANGVKAGHSAGCAVIMVPDLLEPTEEIKPLCTGIYSSLLEAKDYLKV